ncbi:MAG: DUF1592 domain-containing protein [Deltaproteobacteria bacterium]|nr:DUF1592 domain-containing protein [Deltaproteobacteria bacterium]
MSLLVLGWLGSACTGSVGLGDSPEADDGGSTGQGGTGSGARGGASSGGAPSDGADAVVATSKFARLSHKQWENTTRDLLGLPKAPGLTSTFTGDASHGRFDNAGGALQVTDGLFNDYQIASEALAAKVSSDATLLAKLKPSGATGAVQPKPFIEAFGRRAFRRPLTTEEVDRYAALFAKGSALYGAGDASVLGMRAVIEAMLQSPHFLYRIEVGQTNKVVDGKVPLTGWEMASRISYGLANTMPDSELLAAAADGKLQGNVADVRAEVRRHATRLLSSTGGKDAINDFYTQLLRLYTYDGIDKDAAKVPEFVAGIGADMRQETLRFTSEIVSQATGSQADLLTAPFTFVNQRLAKVYGLSGTFTDEFKKVDLDAKQRSGLLTQPGFLASNAHRTEIDSIHRGVFVHVNVMCTNLPPPAKNVPPVPPTGGKTNRERVTAHTGPGTCGGPCHGTLINPAGFAFEKFDAIGKYRTLDNGAAIDDSGSLEIDGVERSWKSSVEFVALLAKSQSVHQCLTGAWLEYLFGRRPEEADAFLVNRVANASLSQSQAIKESMLELVTSEAFMFRAAL